MHMFNKIKNQKSKTNKRTHHLRIHQRILEVGVPVQQLLPQERRVLDVAVQRDVHVHRGGGVGEVEGCEGGSGGGGRGEGHCGVSGRPRRRRGRERFGLRLRESK